MQPLDIAHLAYEGTDSTGSEVLELDLSVTKDRQLVVHHDSVAPLILVQFKKVRCANDVFPEARGSTVHLVVETKMDAATDPTSFAIQVAALIAEHPSAHKSSSRASITLNPAVRPHDPA